MFSYKKIIFVSLVLYINTMFGQEQIAIGQKYVIHSNILHQDRPIIVSLPKNYNPSKSHYPVLYLTDGLQNIWHVVGTLEVLTRTGSVPPMIVVGIESKSRLKDFTITASANHPGSGGGKNFLKFIEKELIPYVESKYSTNSFRVLEGHSLGGLFTASVLLNRPDLFNAYIVMSPAMWWNGEELTKKAEKFFMSHHILDKAIFFGVGTYESGTEYGMRKELKNFVDVITKYQPQKLRFTIKEIEKEGHMAAPLLSNYYGLKFVFSDLAFPKSLLDNYNNQAFWAHEKMIMSKYGNAAKQSAEYYVALATSLREGKRYSEAITVLIRSVEAYPFDVGLMNYLANTYELNGNYNAAINIYKNAIVVSKKYKYNKEEEFENHIRR
ncbi:MAG: alpha/beta hydrolase, partial [Calditrichaeota bacterium]